MLDSLSLRAREICQLFWWIITVWISWSHMKSNSRWMCSESLFYRRNEQRLSNSYSCSVPTLPIFSIALVNDKVNFVVLAILQESDKEVDDDNKSEWVVNRTSMRDTAACWYMSRCFIFSILKKGNDAEFCCCQGEFCCFVSSLVISRWSRIESMSPTVSNQFNTLQVRSTRNTIRFAAKLIRPVSFFEKPTRRSITLSTIVERLDFTHTMCARTPCGCIDI